MQAKAFRFRELQVVCGEVDGSMILGFGWLELNASDLRGFKAVIEGLRLGKC